MTAELYLGSCEQFLYTIVERTKAKVFAEIRKVIYCTNSTGQKAPMRRFRKLPPLHRPGYALPEGAVHYKVDGRRGTILMIWRNKKCQ